MEENTTNNPNEKKSNEHKPNESKQHAKKPSFGAVVADHKAEFRKIVWPNREEVTKKTATVIVVSLIMSLVVFVYDSAFTGGLDLVMSLLGLI